ncbi:MAG: CRISPR-associated ring nuclease [Mariprofundaceae bacterium]|nr:CRISPR-associated ring nuclease [Mariprofundaceae bacterium]
MDQLNVVFVTGHSPAIITETLASLQKADAAIVGEIRVISTRSGVDVLKRRFFDEGAWDSFVLSYPHYRRIRFDSSVIIACPCDDIRCAADNRIMVEAVFGMVRSMTGEGIHRQGGFGCACAIGADGD